MTLVGAGTTGRLVLITGLSTYLHTPCGGPPMGLCFPAGVVSTPG